MKLIITAAFLLLSLFIQAQDFDVYRRKTDDKVKIPQVNQSLELDEFQLLSRNARMMDMAYAMIVPGYMHFKAKEHKIGYYLLAGRMAAYGGLAYSYLNLKDQGESIFGDIKNTDNYQIKQYKYIGIASVSIIFGSYFYDWIHGKVMLEKKQEMIRYKYGFKLQMEGELAGQSPEIKNYPSFWITYRF